MLRYPYSLNPNPSIILTSDREEEVFLLDAGIQLKRQLRGGAQKRLDDCSAFEGIPVSGQDALRLADFPLHGRLLPLLQIDFPGDGDVRLLLFTCFVVDHQGLKTPEEIKRGSESGVTFSHQQRAVQWYDLVEVNYSGTS